MWEKARVIFTIPELRKKILLTFGLLAIYRVGYHITLPMVDQTQLGTGSTGQGGLGDLINQVSVFSASSLKEATIFGLGIMPYISASIIFQLLGSVWKPIEELKKEGEAGMKKINEYTRYLTVVLCLVQSWIYVRSYLLANDAAMVADAFKTQEGAVPFGWQLVAVMIMTCGAVFLMWLGEQIDEFGIGNGISLLIMASILARMPAALIDLIKTAEFRLGAFQGGAIGVETLVVLAVLFVGVVFGVVFITLGQRRIPTQSAKHVRGRRVFGGQKQYLPLRINQAGVMPIIFASSLLMFPGMFFALLTRVGSTGFRSFASSMQDIFRPGPSLLYNLMYIGLIYFFCYFWTAITFNPKEMADNLKEHGTFIPGYRPGRRTAEYLEAVMERITYVGAGFLAAVAIIPTLVSTSLGVGWTVASFYGGTSLLIAVSVAFDLVQKIDSHLVMRNYKGLLEG